MTPKQIEAYVDAASAALDLKLRSDHRGELGRQREVAQHAGAVVEAVPLDPYAEPAVHFSPVVPPESGA